MKSLLLCTVLMVVGGLALGHDGATGIVKERMDAMKDMGRQSKLVARMFKGEVAFNKSELIKTADLFVSHGSKMDEQFPDTEMSRTGSKTEALPLIWEERADFTGHTERFLQDSEELVSTAESTDDVAVLRKVFLKTVKNCSGCHKRFRKPKD